MSGHSKWSTIKRKKGALDAKRGKIFTKLIRELQTAARIGGGDPDSNPRLRLVVDKAKQANMPKDNIQRAIQKGVGGTDGESFEEAIYEGYGPGGTAILIETLSDNKNRTVGDVRHVLSKNGGNLGASGCVAYLFDNSLMNWTGLEETLTGLDYLTLGATVNRVYATMSNRSWNRLSRPSGRDWAWGFRSAAQSSKRTAEL